MRVILGLFKNKRLETMIELLVFSNDWCMPCKKLKMLLNKCNIQYTEIDVEEKIEMTVEYHISALPTMILLKDGEIQKKVVGTLTKAALDEFLKI